MICSGRAGLRLSPSPHWHSERCGAAALLSSLPPDVAFASGRARRSDAQRQLHSPIAWGGSSQGVCGGGKHPPTHPFPGAAFFWCSSFTRSAGILHVENFTGTSWCGETVAPSLEPSSPCSRLPSGCRCSWVCQGRCTPVKASGARPRCGAAGWLLFTQVEPTARNTLNCIFWWKFLLCKLFLLNLSCIYGLVSGCINYNRL